MKIKILIVILLASVFFQSITIAQQDKTKKEGIFLTINNIRNKTGLMRIGVFMDEKGYPDTPALGFSLAKDTIKNNRLRIFIPSIARCLIGFNMKAVFRRSFLFHFGDWRPTTAGILVIGP